MGFFSTKKKRRFFLFHSRRVKVGRCEQKACECFTLCWLGSLGDGGPARILFTALSAHEVSLPGLERGEGREEGRQSELSESPPFPGSLSILAAAAV